MHAIVIGPGLSRDVELQEMGLDIIKLGIMKKKYIIIDGVNRDFIFQDGLWIINNNIDLLENSNKIILTPNIMEFTRLCQSRVHYFHNLQGITNGPEALSELSIKLKDVTIIQKGYQDIIIRNNNSI